ncbi:hypothetical protein PR048_015728 [Dryococelus australis]|uniref:Uncharacterized protein n=1 Tax=Dryococelus australis TaxID=614101 RepID=A0ABQ9HHR5_9NEOP|nr:hypothetical protein PR048_015728 [Dryococelus australis]
MVAKRAILLTSGPANCMLSYLANRSEGFEPASQSKDALFENLKTTHTKRPNLQNRRITGVEVLRAASRKGLLLRKQSTKYGGKSPTHSYSEQDALYLTGHGGCAISTIASHKANWVQSPAGSPDFRKWEPCRTMPLVSGYSRGSPASPPLHSGTAPYSLQSPSSALKTSLLRAPQISSLTVGTNSNSFMSMFECVYILQHSKYTSSDTKPQIYCLTLKPPRRCTWIFMFHLTLSGANPVADKTAERSAVKYNVQLRQHPAPSVTRSRKMEDCRHSGDSVYMVWPRPQISLLFVVD